MTSKQKNNKGKKNSRPYLIIMVLAFLVYGNTLNHGFVLDDEVVFTKNQFVQQGVSGIPNIFTHGFLFGFNQKNDQSYRPLILLNFAIEKQFFDNNPKVHHFFNILFYGISCCLLFYLLRLLFQGSKMEIIWAVVLVFLVHPIHTEVVANIKGRDEILHLIFYLTSLIFLVKYFDFQKSKSLILACFFLFLASLSKEMAITSLAVFPLSLFVFREVKLKRLLALTGYIALPILLYFVIRFTLLDTVTFGEPMTLINNTIAGATSGSSRLATSLFIFSYYIRLFIWSHPLSWDYSYPFFQIREMNEPIIILIAILVLAIGIASLYYLKREKNLIAFGLLFFLFSFSVASNFFILIGSTLGERFLFLPSIGLCLSLIVLIKRVLEEIKVSMKLKKRLFLILAGILILPMSAKTIDRNADWESSKTLFTAGFEATPNNSRAVSAYASIFREIAESTPNPQVRTSNFQEAIAWYKKSIDLYPEVADTWYNLGVCYMGLNQNDKALGAFLEALNHDSNNINAKNNIGVIYFRAKEFKKAESYFKSCLEINQEFPSAHANLGAVYHNTGKLNLAKSYYERALELNPNDQNSRNNLNMLLNN